MSYQKWLDLFGRNTTDKAVRDTLLKENITPDELEIEDDDISVYKNISGQGISLVFTDEAYYFAKDNMAIGEGAPVLTELSLWLLKSNDGTIYKGPLPFDLQQNFPRSSLAKQFGVPIDSGDDPWWDEWKIGRYALIVEYTEDEQSIYSISLELVP